MSKIDDRSLMSGRVVFQAANFPKAYHIRGSNDVTVFGTNQVLLRTSDPVDASALTWAINNVAEIIKELEELRK